MANFSSSNQLMVSVFNNIWDTDNENLTKNCDVKTILDIIMTGDYGVAVKINAIRNAVTSGKFSPSFLNTRVNISPAKRATATQRK